MARKGRGKQKQEGVTVPKVLVGIPCERTVNIDAMDGLVGTCMRAAMLGMGVANFAYRRTDTARNMMVHQLLESQYDWLLMLDSDHQHNPVNLDALCYAVGVHPDIRILAGLTFRRGEPYEPMAYLFADEDGRLVPLNSWGSGLTEVDAVSTAILMVHREVFESMAPPWFYYTYDKYNHGTSASEDIVFCRRVRTETPYKIWVHTQIQAPHITSHYIGESDFRDWQDRVSAAEDSRKES